MIIIKLQGGLGNQIFQYCFARSLSYNLNKELYIDISYFTHEKPRHAIYGLHPFNIKGIVGNYPLINTTSYLNSINNFIFFFKNRKILENYKLSNFIFEDSSRNTENKIKEYFKEPHNSNWNHENKIYPNLFNSMDDKTYFEGYFQFEMDSKYQLFISEQFFNENNELIHNDLKYLLPFTPESKIIAEDMENSNSVLLHVRHGDYTGLLDFGLCSEDYYERSIKTIASKIENPKFFIFSDDIEGAKKLLNIEYPHVFVDFKENNELNGRGNGELLKLMSMCKHFIIANSSLSWWAAFLSENEDKIIISPTPWFQNRRIMGTKTIDNKKTISIINNKKKLFEENKETICSIKHDDFEFKNINYELANNGYKLKNIQKNSKIILKNKNKNNNRIIIKVSIESNHFNCLDVSFKTKDNNKYSKETFKVYYYENDNFEHYLLLPPNAILDNLKIKPGNRTNNDNDYIIIKSLEIKEIHE